MKQSNNGKWSRVELSPEWNLELESGGEFFENGFPIRVGDLHGFLELGTLKRKPSTLQGTYGTVPFHRQHFVRERESINLIHLQSDWRLSSFSEIISWVHGIARCWRDDFLLSAGQLNLQYMSGKVSSPMNFFVGSSAFCFFTLLVSALLVLLLGIFSGKQDALGPNPCKMTYSSVSKKIVTVKSKNRVSGSRLYQYNSNSLQSLNAQPVLFIPGHKGE